MKTQTLEAKEKELNIQFDTEKREAEAIEEQIKALQMKYQDKQASMIRLQGAFALLQDLKNNTKEEETKPEGK